MPQNRKWDPFAPRMSTPPPPVPVTGVTIDQGDTYDTYVTNTFRLTATLAPANTTQRAVTWSSSDPSTVAVALDGTVTAVRAGNAVITVTTVIGGHTDTCAVSVSTLAAGWSLEPQTIFGGLNVSKFTVVNGNPTYQNVASGTYGALLLTNGYQNAIEFTVADGSKGGCFMVGTGSGKFFGIGNLKTGRLERGGVYTTTGSFTDKGAPIPASITGHTWATGNKYRIGRVGPLVKIIQITGGVIGTTIWEGNLTDAWGADSSAYTNARLGVIVSGPPGSVYSMPVNCKAGSWTPQ